MKLVAFAALALASWSGASLASAPSKSSTFPNGNEPRLAHASAYGGVIVSRTADLSPSSAFNLAEKHCETFGKVSVFNTYPDKRRVEFRCGSRKKWLRKWR